jgi:hypothetical protein
MLLDEVERGNPDSYREKEERMKEERFNLII